MVSRLQEHVGSSFFMIKRDPAIEHLRRYLPGPEASEANGQRIRGVFRRGKFMVFMLERGGLLCHNAMSGYWDTECDPWAFDYVEGARIPTETDVRVRLYVGEGVVLRFHDARKFGSLRYVSPEQLAEKLTALGPEVLAGAHLYEPTEIADVDKFGAALAHKFPVKALLMEQKRLAGLGNIYAAEACWKAGVDPNRPGIALSEQDQVNLFLASRDVLSDALARKLDYGGLKIYRREVCPNCRMTVKSETLRGRSTYWCPSCQK